jgi:hypothetical protein
MFSKEDASNNSNNKPVVDQATIVNNESVDTSSHSSFEEVHINNQKASDITDTLEEVNPNPNPNTNPNEKQTNTEITIYKVASNAEEKEEEYEADDDNIEMFNPFFNLEDILLKLSEKHESLDQEFCKLTKTNNLKQHAINEILKTVSGLRSHRYNSEDAILSATLIINDALDRILTIFENNHFKYLNSFRKRTENFSLNVNNSEVLNNLCNMDKEMLNRMVEKLILDGQEDYSEPCLFYTNPSNDRFFMLRDKKIVSILKTLSEFVKDLLSLVPGLVFEEEEEKKKEPEVVITPQAIIDAQMEAIFEQPVTTRRKSKRRGGF